MSFNKIALKFNEQAKIFNKEGFYCNAPFRSKDFTSVLGRSKKLNVEQV